MLSDRYFKLWVLNEVSYYEMSPEDSSSISGSGMRLDHVLINATWGFGSGMRLGIAERAVWGICDCRSANANCTPVKSTYHRRRVE